MAHMMDEKGQMIILFAAVVVVIIVSVAYLNAQNIIAGMESSRTMLAYPKEEIRNLREIREEVTGTLGNVPTDVNRQIEILCAKNGWLCNIKNNIVVFKNVEVCYCEEFGGSCQNQC